MGLNSKPKVRIAYCLPYDIRSMDNRTAIEYEDIPVMPSSKSINKKKIKERKM